MAAMAGAPGVEFVAKPSTDALTVVRMDGGLKHVCSGLCPTNFGQLLAQSFWGSNSVAYARRKARPAAGFSTTSSSTAIG